MEERAQLGKILVVEDERIVALDLAMTLTELGYVVVDSVATGEDAVARAGEAPPDVVLMDIRLAGAIDGIQAADRIRSTRDIPIIYLTAHADDETLRRAKATEPFGYLVKPFKAVELRCAIEIAMHKHEIDTRLRAREQWLVETLRSIGGAAANDASHTNPVAQALTGWPLDDAFSDRLGEIRSLVDQALPTGDPVTAAPISDDELHARNAEIEVRVGERTAELEAANRELEAFSASVAHDLRAPLRHIEGFSQMLLEDHAANLGSDGLDLLRRVRGAATRMSQLVEDLLRLARVGKAELDRRTVDVSAMSHAIVQGLVRGHQPNRAAVTIAPDLIVDADPGLLQILLENLLSNAWKFTARVARPEITIGACDDPGGRGVFVRDNGAGFDAAHADKLFGAFQRFHPSSQFDGNGVGLAIAERIVKRHGGRIWAESQPGAGATFRFVL